MRRSCDIQAGDTLEVADTFNWGDLILNNTVRVENQPISSSVSSHTPRRMKNGFDPWIFWGDHHILPRIEASGRWENLPICKHPGIGYETTSGGTKTSNQQLVVNDIISKPHKLIACLWASASFTTRGNAQAVSDTTARLVEWIEFHLLVGFDHIYVYDNTGAHTNETSLETTLFPRFLDTEVTRIDWVSFLQCVNTMICFMYFGSQLLNFISSAMPSL